jgi:glycosyltransferase involved in cell wall biosynthesis
VLNVLHITNWYPGSKDPARALWIKRHIESIAPYCNNQVFHIEHIASDRWRVREFEEDGATHLLFHSPTTQWAIIEVFTTLLLVFAFLFRVRWSKVDIINVHIAYPLLTYYHLLRRFIARPIVITEHWSAYHFDFNITKKEKLKRIRRIFQRSIPVIAVSRSLADDIKRFSQNCEFPSFIIPNIVDENVFHWHPKIEVNTNKFYMLSQWKWPKLPDLALIAFKEYLHSNPDAILNIGGEGPDFDKLTAQVADLGIAGKVNFLGFQSPGSIASEMNESKAFIHITEYETFSVVCAEAVCCGTPLIASNTGGLKEFVNEDNGFLVNNSVNDIYKGMISMDEVEFDRQNNSASCTKKFNVETIGRRYYKALQEVFGGYKT